MKIVIIGKKGQLGQELCKKGETLGYKIVGFSSRELDITNWKNVFKIVNKEKPDIIMNASAFHVVADCDKNPEQAFLVNATAVKHLADICEEQKITFVHFSTDYVFDGTKGTPYGESDSPNPLQIYGISKYAGERTCLQYCKNSYVVRVCGLFGGKKGSREKKGNFILTIIKQIQGQTKLEVSSEQIVSPTYAGDVAEAVFKLIAKKAPFGLYHLVNEGNCSWAGFAAEIVNQIHHPVKIIPTDRKGQSGGTRRPLFSALKNTKAKKIGIVLPPWQNALRRYLHELSYL